MARLVRSSECPMAASAPSPSSPATTAACHRYPRPDAGVAAAWPGRRLDGRRARRRHGDAVGQRAPPPLHGGMPSQPGGEQPLTTTTSSLRSFCGCKGMPLDADGRLIRLLLGVRQGFWTSLDACRHQCGGPTNNHTCGQNPCNHWKFQKNFNHVTAKVTAR